MSIAELINRKDYIEYQLFLLIQEKEKVKDLLAEYEEIVREIVRLENGR